MKKKNVKVDRIFNEITLSQRDFISHNSMHNIIQTTASMDVQTVVAMCVVGS